MSTCAGNVALPVKELKLWEWKKRDPRTPAHLMPLPTPAAAIPRDIFPLIPPNRLNFQSLAKRFKKTRYMADNTVNSLLHGLE